MYKLIVRTYENIDLFHKNNRYDERYPAVCFSSQSIKRLSRHSGGLFDPGSFQRPLGLKRLNYANIISK